MEVYSVKEVMSILKVSQNTLLSLLKNKKIRGMRTSEGKTARWIIPADSVKEFLQGA